MVDLLSRERYLLRLLFEGYKKSNPGFSLCQTIESYK